MKKLRLIQPSQASAAAAEGSTVVRNKMPHAVRVSDEGHTLSAKETGAIDVVDGTLRSAIDAGHVVVLAESAKKPAKPAKKAEDVKPEEPTTTAAATDTAPKEVAKQEAAQEDVDSAEASF